MSAAWEREIGGRREGNEPLERAHAANRTRGNERQEAEEENEKGSKGDACAPTERVETKCTGIHTHTEAYT